MMRTPPRHTRIQETATYLQLQTAGGGPAWSVELCGGVVRIGQDSRCEVVLSEPGVASVQCVLRRRGACWLLEPQAPGVTVEGRAVTRTQPLSFGVPIRSGTTWLALKRGVPRAEAASSARFESGSCGAGDREEAGASAVAAGVEAASGVFVDAGRDGGSERGEGARVPATGGESCGAVMGSRVQRRRIEPARWGTHSRAVRQVAAPQIPVMRSAPLRRADQGGVEGGDRVAAEAFVEGPAGRAGRGAAPPPARDVPLLDPRWRRGGSATGGVVAPGDSQAAGDAGDAAKTETQDTGVAEVSGRDEGIEPIHHGIIENQLLIEVAEEVPAGAEELGNLATSQQESSESAAVEVIGVKAQDAGGEGLPSARSFFDTSEATRVIAGLEAALTGEAGADAGLGGVSGTESPVDHGDVVRIAPPGEGPAQTAFRAQSHAAARGGDVEPSARRGDGASGGTEAVGGAGLLPSGSHLKDPDGWPSARLILGPPGLSPMERPRGRTHEGKAGGRGQTSGSENAAGVRSGGKGATVHGTKAAGGAKFQAPSDRKRRVAVSVASGPRVMELPRWFAAPVALLCWLVVMPVLCWVCWAWVQDAQRANEILSQVRAAGLSSGGTELDLSGGETAWWRTRPEHLVWRAMALDRSAGDARTLEEVDFLLTAALQSAPGDPAARAASVARRMRSLPTNARMLDVRLVGLSRDAWPMVETAGRLARAGQVDPAIEAYHRAFELLLRDPTLPWQEPFFLEGGAERFALPREREARGLVDRLADDRGITFARWSTILPSDGAMWLAAYAVLKERGRAEAQSALQTILGLELREDRERAAVVLAAKAEASVALGKWHEAIEKYEKAIQHQPDAAIRRSWSYNKARIHARLGQRAECEQAWLEARGSTGQDALSRLVDRGMARLGFGGQDPGRGEGNRAAGVPGAATGKAGSRDGIIDRSENRGRER